MGVVEKIKSLPYFGALKILFVIILIIVSYWIFLRLTYASPVNGDFMNVRIFNVPQLENCCSWWPVSHVVLFGILGALYPEYWLQLLTLGAAWEGIEVILSYLTRSQRQSIRSSDRSNKIEYSKDWWAGSFKDIIMNILGFIIGAGIAGMFLENGRLEIKGVNM